MDTLEKGYDDIEGWKDAYRVEAALACPFCGDAPMVVPWHGGTKHKRMIMCRSAHCTVGPQVAAETEKKALANWNQRA